MDKKILAIIAVIVVILVACGAYFAMGSSGDTVRIGHLQSDTQFNNGGDLMTAVAAGDIDVGYVGITPAMSSISKGVPVKVVSGAQTEGSGLVVDKDSNINSIADLKGKTVATPGAATIQQMLLTDVLNQNGMDIKDLKVTNLKAAQMVDAIKSNQIDAFIIWEPYSTIAVQSGEGKLLMNSSEIESGHPCCCIVATGRFTKTLQTTSMRTLRKLLNCCLMTSFLTGKSKVKSLKTPTSSQDLMLNTSRMSWTS